MPCDVSPARYTPHMTTIEQLREWDRAHVWHPFTPMQAYRLEETPIIARAEGFWLIDVAGQRYLDGISSLWCNVHGHAVPEIDEAIRNQLDQVGHSTLLGLANVPSIQLARELVLRAPAGLEHVFYSDSGSTAVEAALKIAFQYQQQRSPAAPRRTRFATVRGAYHGDTLGSVSVGSIDLFHAVYGQLLFPTLSVPAPVALRVPPGQTRAQYLESCFSTLEQLFREHGEELAAFIIEPLVQGAAGILVHPPGYLRKVRELTQQYDVLLIADEVAVGFGRTGTLFACEQEQVTPDLLCVAKGLTGGYLPLAATLATSKVFEAFLAPPAAGKTFFHGHTFTGNPLGCAAALASLSLFEQHDLLGQVRSNAVLLAERLAPLKAHPHVAEVRQRGIMVGIELVADRETLRPFPPELRLGHRVTLAARELGVILRPLGDVIVLMPAPAMPAELIEHLCESTLQAIDAALSTVTAG